MAPLGKTIVLIWTKVEDAMLEDCYRSEPAPCRHLQVIIVSVALVLPFNGICSSATTLQHQGPGSGCPNHANHPNSDLSTLPLPMNLVPAIEKDILQSMADACIGAAVRRNYIFSKLCKFITKVQIAYYTSEASRPMAVGLEKADTNGLLEFFEATAEISYQTLWDVPLVTGKIALVSCLNLDRQKGFAEIDHSNGTEFIEPRESAMIC